MEISLMMRRTIDRVVCQLKNLGAHQPDDVTVLAVPGRTEHPIAWELSTSIELSLLLLQSPDCQRRRRLCARGQGRPAYEIAHARGIRRPIWG